MYYKWLLNFWDPKLEEKKIITKFYYPLPPKKLAISDRFGIGDTIPIGREIQCLPYAGFLDATVLVDVSLGTEDSVTYCWL